MSLISSQASLANRRNIALLVFYTAALLSACTLSLVGKGPAFRALLFAFAIGGAAVAVLFLIRFLRTNDEREQQINYRALTFAFTGTLVFSLIVGFLQSL